MGTTQDQDMNLHERNELFLQRTRAVDPVPETREDIIKTLAHVYRCDEREVEILIQLIDADDRVSALALITELLSRESFLREPDTAQGAQQPQP